MSGWRTTKDVLQLRDEVVEKLESAPKATMRHAWYWISFHVNFEHEMQDEGPWSIMDDETIQWLREHPARLEKMIASKKWLIETLKARLLKCEEEMRRLTQEV